MREMKSLQWRSSCCNNGNKSPVGVQKWGLYQSSWENDWLKRIRSRNNAVISQRTYLNLGMVNIQGSVWGLIMFIGKLVGEVSLCSSTWWALMTDSQWEGFGGFVDIIWKMTQKCAVVMNRVNHILGCVRRSGAISSREVIIPLHLVLVGCTWNKSVKFLVPR